MAYWTNPSVLRFAGDSDPITLIENTVRNIVLRASEEGWEGPPFDPSELASYLGITVSPRDDIQDARTVPLGRRFHIEFNPNRPRGRIRFSIAHEIGHTLFSDCAETIRARGLIGSEDNWQLELLCNIAAAEILMPIGTAANLEREDVTIDNVLRLQREYDVSTEAICLRLVKITDWPCVMFAAARTSSFGKPVTYRVDYSVASRSTKLDIPHGFEIQNASVLSQCTAIGYTAKGSETMTPALHKVQIECVGIPSYPGEYFPRVVGFVLSQRAGQLKTARILHLWGDALEPRGTGYRIVAHIVNDKTANWGGLGFAHAAKKRLPTAQDYFRAWAAQNKDNLSLGRIHLAQVADDLAIVSMIAQHGYGPSRKPRIRYGALKSCLDQLAEIALARNASIHMPKIGTGEAGGKWPVIAELIDEAIIMRGVEVTVYSLPASQTTVETQGLLGLNIEATQ